MQEFFPSELCSFFAALTRSYAGATGPFFSLHSDIIVPYISKYGSDEQRKRFIPSMTAGTCITSIGMSEPGAGRYSAIQSFSGHEHKTSLGWGKRSYSISPFLLTPSIQASMGQTQCMVGLLSSASLLPPLV